MNVQQCKAQEERAQCLGFWCRALLPQHNARTSSVSHGSQILLFKARGLCVVNPKPNALNPKLKTLSPKP